ncbi:MAG: response regulator [Thiovulaceae bacterium]|nr:response regulator [Sulfurimonadaceae bacterium]MDD3816871.1 response regulator [Sulfurimonadaceae bacterium]
MRFLLLLSFLAVFVHAMQSRLVIGTYSSERNAHNAEKELQNFIGEDANFRLFVTSNKLTTNVLEYGKYYIVALEPFDDVVLERFALSKLIVRYDGTYVLPLTEGSHKKSTLAQNSTVVAPAKTVAPKIVDTNEEVYLGEDPILVKEPSLEELPVKTEESKAQSAQIIASQKKKEDIVTQTSQTTKQNTQETSSKKESSVVGEFMFEIIALIAILIAIVAYFLIKKSKYKKEENNPLQEIVVDEYDAEEQETPNGTEKQTPRQETPQVASKETADVVAQNEEIVTQETIPMDQAVLAEEHTETFGGKEEGSFGVVETTPPQQEQQPKKTRRKKREVPPHAKITKQNFKEFTGMRILVAEDNLINQKVISGLLADTGIEIVIADDGKEALDILKKDSNFTLILMDAHMPRIDGFEATRKIRANPDYDHILVVALSGDTAADDIKKMQAAGMEEHLEKPLKMDSLYDILYAYWEGEETESSDEYIEVIMTNELNGDEGLNICGGDEGFYKEILNEFLTTYSDSAEKIHAYLASGDMPKADKLLLDIVGITSNIGAKNLNAIAHDLKDALADTQEKSYLTLAEEYEKHLHYLLRDIKAYNK